MIGILGGSFDPIHLGHVHLAQEILRRYSLDKVYFVPARTNPLRESATSATPEQRLEMVQLAIAEINSPNLKVLDVEIQDPRPSQSLRTVEYIKNNEHEDVAFIMGNEVFSLLSGWYKPNEFLKATHVIVVGRKENLPRNMRTVLQNCGINDFHILNNGLRVEHSAGTRWVEVAEIPVLPYSATEIRTQLTHRSDTIHQVVPQGIQRSVWQYIKENQLYAVR